jgi:transcriptional regulator with XRE-family HTH domain
MKKTSVVNSGKHEKSFTYRFRDERERANLSQEEVAEICGVSSRTVISWEKGAKIPAESLALLMPHGVDAIYVLSGRRENDPLHMLVSRGEYNLIIKYRAGTEDDRRYIDRVTDAISYRQFEKGANPYVRRRKLEDNPKE